jgi:hypothetical protein
VTASVRNVLIIAALAALIDLLPGGGTGASVAIQAVSITFLAAVGWVASLMYREHRRAIYSLGERRRAILYASLAAITLTLTAHDRLWRTGGGKLVWLVLLVAEVYAAAAVVYSARRY